ncbi:hypothetical protein CQR79_05080 [Aggregatibacter actinomycetemcomitans]|nr:hypothetical protein CQR79_05080 [Aggregatibacter actinomycetemcomitans]
MMREVEVLQDYLLHLLQQEPDLTPKDIIVIFFGVSSGDCRDVCAERRFRASYFTGFKRA